MSFVQTAPAPSRALQRFYPWVVIAIAFLTVAMAFGARNAFAVFLIAVIDEFHWSRALASGALMLSSVVWTVVAPVIGLLLDRFGPRPVLAGGSVLMALGFVISGLAHSVFEFYLGMGVFVGVGFAALPMTSQATFLTNWFVRKRGMAIGVAASGIGLGILIVVPLVQWLIVKFGWRQSFFILAGLLVLLVAPLNLFFQRQRPEEMNLKPDFGEPLPQVAATNSPVLAGTGVTLREALRTGRFWAFALGVLCGAIPLHMVLIHQVAAVSDSGFSKELSALGLGLIGLFTAPFMILMGLLADRLGREWSYTLGSVALMIGIGLLMFIDVARQTWLLYTFHRLSLSAFHRASRSIRRSPPTYFTASPLGRSSELLSCSSALARASALGLAAWVTTSPGVIAAHFGSHRRCHLYRSASFGSPGRANTGRIFPDELG